MSRPHEWAKSSRLEPLLSKSARTVVAYCGIHRPDGRGVGCDTETSWSVEASAASHIEPRGWDSEAFTSTEGDRQRLRGP